MGIKATANTSHTNYGDLIFLCGFDEGTGSTTADLIGALSGTLGGATDPAVWGTADGTYGNIVTFADNSDSHVDFGDDASLDGLSECTVFMWYRSASTASDTNTKNPFGKQGAGEDSYQMYWLTNENVGVTLDLGSDINASISDGLDDGSSGAVATNWNGIGFTWDGAELITRINTTKSSAVAAVGTMNATAHSLIVGNKQTSGANSANGDVAIFAIFDAGLSDSDWNAMVANPMDLFPGAGGGSSALPLLNSYYG